MRLARSPQQWAQHQAKIAVRAHQESFRGRGLQCARSVFLAFIPCHVLLCAPRVHQGHSRVKTGASCASFVHLEHIRRVGPAGVWLAQLGFSRLEMSPLAPSVQRGPTTTGWPVRIAPFVKQGGTQRVGRAGVWSVPMAPTPVPVGAGVA